MLISIAGFKRCVAVWLMLIVTTAFAQHTNVKVGSALGNGDPQEPSIIVNYKNTDHMLIGANKDNYYYSTDAGLNWVHGQLTSPLGVWGDPCVIVDTTGSFYFFHLSDPAGVAWVDRIMCQKTGRLGGKWSDGTYMGLNGSKLQDKEWAAVDVRTNAIYVTWTQFDQYGSIDPKHFSNIMFSKSTDAGETWSPALRINTISGDCRDDDNTVEGAVPAIGPEGEIYVSWAGPAGIVFDKSNDRGATWLDTDIFVSDIPGGWALTVPGIMRCNGMPVTACDVSNGPHRGTIYINWSDQRHGVSDTDVWLSKSTDAGETWSAPIRVNDDGQGKHQFFTWMTIDQTNGYLYFVFYDRRYHADTSTDVVCAVSRDGGETFINFKVSETPFAPNQSVFFGDYTNISGHNNVIRPVWARLDNSDLSLWTAIIDPGQITELPRPAPDVQPTGFEFVSVYPNPFNASIMIEYIIPRSGEVVVKVFDVLGKEIETVFSGNQAEGEHQVSWLAEGVASGIYFVHAKFANELKTTKVTLSK
ncbi:MAG: T9SS type A sorting domain-containing protein [Candidatus Zhuqueibacterota bacterium]